MQVQLNAPNGPNTAVFSEFVERTVREVLAPYEEKLTRVELHLRDVNANKGGVDKHCMVEARPRGLDPVVATHESTQFDDAVHGALHKLKRVLDSRFGRLATKGH